MDSLAKAVSFRNARLCCVNILRDARGSSAAEFAMMMPIMAIMLFGIIKFGLVFNNYIQLTHAASAAARQLSISRGSTTPYTGTVTAMRNAAPTLKAASINSVFYVNNVACTADNTACQGAFGTTSGAQARVALNYPCNLTLPFIPFPNCNLGVNAAGMVQ